MIRQGTLFDIDGVVGLGREALGLSQDDDLVVDEKKMRAQALTCLAGKGNFAWVSEDNGIQGALLAESHPMVFHKGNQASVVQFHCKKPGDGVKLLNKFIDWFEARPLKAIVFTLEYKCDPRIIDLLTRKDFIQQFPVLMRTKHVQGSEALQEACKENIQRAEKAI